MNLSQRTQMGISKFVKKHTLDGKADVVTVTKTPSGTGYSTTINPRISELPCRTDPISADETLDGINREGTRLVYITFDGFVDVRQSDLIEVYLFDSMGEPIMDGEEPDQVQRTELYQVEQAPEPRTGICLETQLICSQAGQQ